MRLILIVVLLLTASSVLQAFQTLRPGIEAELTQTSDGAWTKIALRYSLLSPGTAYAKINTSPCSASPAVATQRGKAGANQWKVLRAQVPRSCSGATVIGSVFILDEKGQPIANIRRELLLSGSKQDFRQDLTRSVALPWNQPRVFTPSSGKPTVFALSGRKGSHVRIAVDCADSDPAAALYGPDKSLLASGDDEEGWNARLSTDQPILLPSDGEYKVAVNSIYSGKPGSCRILATTID